MAIIRFEGREMEVPDASPIAEACEVLGIPFGCRDGSCDTCTCTVVTGLENLEGKNKKENARPLAADERLACQCVVKSGVVELHLD